MIFVKWKVEKMQIPMIFFFVILFGAIFAYTVYPFSGCNRVTTAIPALASAVVAVVLMRLVRVF